MRERTIERIGRIMVMIIFLGYLLMAIIFGLAAFSYDTLIADDFETPFSFYILSAALWPVGVSIAIIMILLEAISYANSTIYAIIFGESYYRGE